MKISSEVIGCGAAGGKVVEQLINDRVLSVDNCLIINSTDQDRPDVNCKFINIGKDTDLGGAAKEPQKGREMVIDAMQNQGLTESISQLMKADTRKVYVITSLEGGTGCGSSIVVAQYVKDVIGIPVHIIAIAGFEDDPRGLKNMISFFKQIDPEYTMSIISNKKFLKDAHGDKLKAEKLCNKEISTIISILNGHMIYASEKNIDANDLFKLSTKPGYMSISYKETDDKIRNFDQFNSVVKDMIDNSKSMDLTDPKQVTMGVIINLPPDEQQYIDYSYSVLTDHYNTGDSACYEIFTHVQNKEDIAKFIAFINAGMQLPLEEVQRMYNNYSDLKKRSEQEAAAKKNAFFAGMDSIMFDEDDNDLKETKAKKSSADFFASLGATSTVKNNNKKNNKVDNNF